ncbi:hypothetical protein S7711_01086 [Stachybotrys chartarum IBT 7711]|uniref:Tyrosinase copper-binding domain-containing protein n=1 Tax=Stachybotrys chartarum (strain CBS 109288 / IBT 7711) TaxID=1280523 RepID=A0A084B4D9_STACB|nr:hypothetical protein S7711_01086 [Stachybotrys chartarum IBT 7711]KFA54323.1 hypothetical protein S40293_04841 [Stachybotrys chartarum IBT 40293]KFA74408.1 hypothetical protein S40288_03993 [Stachybotrys chartarum IBT 40288]
MSSTNLTLFFSLAALCLSVAATCNQTDYVQQVQDQAATALLAEEPNAVLIRNSTCTLENAGVRRNWEALSREEKHDYIRAVNCMFDAPARTDPSLAGTRVRYDDFAAQHINQTLSVHVTGNFLTWHRHYIWSYEQALRNECGYKGYLPYWNWFSYQDDLRTSPVFDGSDTSVGSDGLFVQHNGSTGTAGLHIPSGLGGGCIATGPFSNLTANLGPVQPQQDGLVGVGRDNKLVYNPHCITRDLSSWLASRIYTREAFLNATVRGTARDIASFQSEIELQSNGLPGIHSGGHQTLSGANSDLYSGVTDPAFYVHHAMVDRLYWMWQALHYDQRKTISGTITFGNNPVSRNATLDDLIELPFLDVETAAIGNLLDTLDGPYCYRYE